MKHTIEQILELDRIHSHGDDEAFGLAIDLAHAAQDLMPQPMDRVSTWTSDPTRVYVPSMLRWVDAAMYEGSWYLWPADVHGRGLIHPTHWRKEPTP